MKTQIKPAAAQLAGIKHAMITLKSGHVVLVDHDDLEVLLAFNWRVTPSGYAIRNVSIQSGVRRTARMHRQIIGAPQGFEVDHINGNRLDNRKINLRICTRTQNGRNQLPQVGRRSQFKGVDWFAPRKKWRARIKVSGQSIGLGYFTHENDAARAYDIAAQEHFHEYAKPNFFEMAA